MSKHTTKPCQWCGIIEVPRWRGVICTDCEDKTRLDVLHALLYDTREAIFGLYPTRLEALESQEQDETAHDGYSRLILRRVTGQAGARSALGEHRDDDPMQRVRDLQTYYREVST